MSSTNTKIKSNIYDLAIFSKVPAFPEKLHVGRPNIGSRENLLARINDMLDRKWLTNHGQFVQEFERKIAEYIGVKHCIATCNGTVALELAIRGLGLTGEVLVPSFTFIATAHALQWQEITPVFCDVDPNTHTIDPSRLQEMITPRTSGIIGVHVWGNPCDVEALTQIAVQHNLKLMFDAAHAFGCSHNNQMIGNFGEVEVFSFHATKFINAFEGGAITTNNNDLAEKIRLMTNFGFAGLDNVIYIGTNGKMNEASAAMGLTSLESLEEFIEINYRNYQCYQNELADIVGISLFDYHKEEHSNYQYIVLEIDEILTGVSRDTLVKILEAENVIARRYFYPGCHRMEPYRSYFPHAGFLLPETEKLTQRVMLLPTGSAINLQDIQEISQIIRLSIYNGKEIEKKLCKQLTY